MDISKIQKIDYTNNINNNLIIYPNYNVYNINNYNFEKNKFLQNIQIYLIIQ